MVFVKLQSEIWVKTLFQKLVPVTPRNKLNKLVQHHLNLQYSHRPHLTSCRNPVSPFQSHVSSYRQPLTATSTHCDAALVSDRSPSSSPDTDLPASTAMPVSPPGSSVGGRWWSPGDISDTRLYTLLPWTCNASSCSTLSMTLFYPDQLEIGKYHVACYQRPCSTQTSWKSYTCSMLSTTLFYPDQLEIGKYWIMKHKINDLVLPRPAGNRKISWSKLSTTLFYPDQLEIGKYHVINIKNTKAIQNG